MLSQNFHFVFILALIFKGCFVQAVLPTRPPNCAAVLCPAGGPPAYGELYGQCREFPNSCLMNVENCFRRQRGQPGSWTAVSSCRDQCPDVCTLEYKPVCASDGCSFKTFSNLCFLGIHNCKNKSSFTVLHEGGCQTCPAY